MGTKYKGTPHEILAVNTYIKLIRASDSLRSRLISTLTKHNLSESQFYALDALFHLGPLPQKEISKKISCSDGNITMVVDNLEREGLVTRKRSETDRRVFFVHITKKGEKKINSVLPLMVHKITKALSVLNEAELEELPLSSKKIGISGFVSD